jgi:hypothetical protein
MTQAQFYGSLTNEQKSLFDKLGHGAGRSLKASLPDGGPQSRCTARLGDALIL